MKVLPARLAFRSRHTPVRSPGNDAAAFVRYCGGRGAGGSYAGPPSHRSVRGGPRAQAALQSAFSSIVIVIGLRATASAETKSILNPMHGSNRLDWCRGWSIGCGQAAADAYCKGKGFAHAVDFGQNPDIGVSSPSRSICDRPFRDGFQSITCSN
jgi:hypothetical protein